jgi:hypothetical protein
MDRRTYPWSAWTPPLPAPTTTQPGCASAREVMDALEEAAIEQERARQKGAARQNGTVRTAVTTPVGKSGGTSGDGASSA